jgi:hypothetical protein
MIQQRRDFGFADEALAERGIAREVGTEHLERVTAGQRRILGQIHRSRRAGGKNVLDPIPPFSTTAAIPT